MKDVSIKTKLLLLVILSIFIVSLVLIISSIISINYISESNINKYEKESYKSKEIELRNHVEAAINTVKGIAQDPTFASLEEKQKVAKEVVKNMIYGEDGYFWINDSNHVLVMHAVKPENVGKNMYDSKDPNGVMIYQEIVKVANAKKEGGLVKYGWSKPGLDGVQPKFSYVIRYADWDWIIGTGAYVDDVQREVDAMKNETKAEINDIVIKTLMLSLSIAFIISFLFIFISNKVIITPILKFQNELFIEVFRNYAMKQKGVYFSLSPEKKENYIENAIQRDIKFRNSLKGIVFGMFTVSEYKEYTQNSSNLNKRMMNLLIERLKSQIQII